MITAELISIGDELLIGQTINTNASWLGQQLALLGIKVTHVATISDDESAIVAAFDAAFARNQLIIVTGGLGPTKDDITKHVLADYFDSKLVMNERVLAHITDFFTKRNRPMLETNIQQAALPDKCEVLFNRFGTAAGMWFEKNNSVLLSMPGVPYEMKTIFTEEAVPKITTLFGKLDLYHRTVLTQGMGESFLAELLADWEDRIRDAGLSLAYLPAPGSVKLRLTSFRGEQDAALIDAFIKELKDRVPRYVFGEGDETLPGVVGKILIENNVTVGTVESCTGGSIAAALTMIPGSSAYFQGSLITYSNGLKINLAGVEPRLISDNGAVSQEVVESMALGGKIKLGVDWCIATSGIAGPDGGSDEKPVGTVWIAIAGPDSLYSKRFLFGDNRERNIQMAVLTTLNCMRCELLSIKE